MKTRTSVTGTLVVAAVVTGAFTVYSSGISGQRDDEYDRERRVIVRWAVDATRPANVLVLGVSSLSGAQVIAETTISGSYARDITLIKNETLSLTVSGELPVDKQRGSVTCKIFVNGKEVVNRSRVVRSGEPAEGVKCEYKVTG